jgi:phage gp36-like protein
MPAPGPSNLAASVVSTSQINLTWTQVDAVPIADKIIQGEYATENTFALPTLFGTADSTVTSKSLTSLVPGTTYYFRIRTEANASSETPTFGDWSATASASTATGAYNTQADLENRWGVQNIARWSNLVASVTTTDTARVQLAVLFAAAEIDDYFAGSRYTAPLTGIGPGSSTSVKVREWANVIAGKWLADARFHATNEAVPDDLIAQLDAVYTDMALHKSGVRGFGAAQVFSNHPAVPVTTG